MPLVQSTKDESSALFVTRQAMNRASIAFLEALDGYTLSDLVQPGAKLRTLLGVR